MRTVGQDNYMNYYYKKIFIGCIALSAMVLSSYASQISIVAPNKTLSNRMPVVVQFLLDPEEDTISGISGNFSFPSEMFTLDSISVDSSVVTLWVNQPAVSYEKYLDNRTHVTFEGIFPGGYDGVRSPYYQGKKSGILFSVALTPKSKGNGTLLLDDIILHAFDSQATSLPIASLTKLITVPDLIPPQGDSTSKLPLYITSPTLSAFITRDLLVNNNAWYLMINESEAVSSIQKIFVAETNDYEADSVSDDAWRTAKNPYVLLYQNRTKNVHIKIIYSNHTYTTFTIHAVENFNSISYLSRILISIVIVVLFIYLYGKNVLIFFKNKQ